MSATTAFMVFIYLRLDSFLELQMKNLLNLDTNHRYLNKISFFKYGIIKEKFLNEPPAKWIQRLD